jgi:hypothetical protein
MSKVSRTQLHTLWQEGQRTRQPITEIVAFVIQQHCARQTAARPMAAETHVTYSTEPRPAA